MKNDKDKNDMIRTFIAIPLPVEVKRNLEAAENNLKRQISDDVKWVSVHSMHVTLKFIGDVAESSIADISQNMKSVLVQTRPFHFELRTLGAFPNERRPQVIWAGIQGAEQILSDLHKKLDDAMARLGIEREGKGFHPHITLGRIKYCQKPDAIAQAIDAYKDTSFGKVDANSVILFQSVLKPTGAIYTPLYEYKLSETAGS